MISELKILDSVEFKCNVGNKFVCDVSEDNHTSIITDRGVLICNLEAVKDNKTQAICYNKKIIKTSQFILQNNLGIELEEFMPNLNSESTRDVLVNLKFAIPLSPNTICKPVCAKWSSIGCIGRKCIIAVQNDFGSLDLYFEYASCTGLTEYRWLQNITDLHIEKYKEPAPFDFNGKSSNEVVEEYKKRINLHLFTAFTWSHIIEDTLKRFCLLVVAYQNGKIVFWVINYCNIEDHKDIKCEFMADFDTSLNNIKCLHWMESVNSGLLFIGTNKGSLCVLPITNISSTIQFSEMITLIQGSGVLAPVDKIFSTQHENHHYLFVVQMEIITIFLFNSQGEILDSLHFTVGSTHISDIVNLGENSFLVASLTGDLREIKINCEQSKLNIDWKYIYVNLNWSIYRCIGLFASKNKVIFSFLLDCSKPIRIKDEKDTIYLTNVINTYFNPLEILLNNKSNSLKDHYDYLEAVRVTGLFSKKLICEQLPEVIDYESMNLLQLKTYLYLSIISEYLYDQIETVPKYTLRQSKDLEQMIQIKLIVYYAQKLINQRDQKKFLGKFKSTSLKLIISYLKEIILDDSVVKRKLGNNIVDEIFDIISRTTNETLIDLPVCSICQESIFGTGCLNLHFTNRCMISLMEIIAPKYKCRQCNKYVSEEVMKEFENFLCPFCDSELETLFDQCLELSTNLSDVCKDDCIKESPFSIVSLYNNV